MAKDGITIKFNLMADDLELVKNIYSEYTQNINKNNYVPVDGFIDGDKFIAATQEQVARIIETKINNLTQENREILVKKIDKMLNTLTLLANIAIESTDKSGQKSYRWNLGKVITDKNRTDEYNKEHTIRGYFASQVWGTTISKEKQEENLLNNTIDRQWSEISSILFKKNIVETSLVVGYNVKDVVSIKDPTKLDEAYTIGNKLTIGMVPSEKSFTNDINHIYVAMDKLLDSMHKTYIAEKRTEKEREEYSKALNGHFKSLQQSISANRDTPELIAAYIFLYYRNPKMYAQKRDRNISASSYQDILWKPSGKGIGGYFFEAFMQHMQLYHNFQLTLQNCTSITFQKEPYIEEGIPNFFNTIYETSNNTTAWFAGGDFVSMDSKGKIIINSQIKSASDDTYFRGDLSIKALYSTCNALKSAIINSGNNISAYTAEVAKNLMNTAWRKVKTPINEAINTNINDLITENLSRWVDKS